MKKLKLLRLVNLLIVMVMMISIFTACSGSKTGVVASVVPTSTTNAVSAQPTDKTKAVPDYLSDTSPITFDWYVDASWYTYAKWGQDATSKYITKKTGVSINFILPTGNEAEKKNIMIASGDVPDFISMGQWEPARKKMIESGLVYSLNELSDKYNPKFWDATTKSVKDWYTEADGKIYGYPCCNTPIERQNDPTLNKGYSYIGFTVKKDMYDAIGKPDMTTPDGFLNALKLAKEKFPKVGTQPIVPFQMYDFTPNGNVGLEDNLAELLNIPFEDANGKLTQRLTDPEFVTWLKTIRKANELGLMSLETYTDKAPQIEEKYKAGRVFSGLYAVNTVAGKFNADFYKKDPNTIYIPINGMMNSKKEEPKFKSGGLAGWMYTSISKKNKNPERAIKFMNYLMSQEGQDDMYLGDPDVTRVPGKKEIKSDVYDLKTTNSDEFAKKYGNMDNYFMLLDPSLTDKYKKPLPEYEAIFYEFQKGKAKDTTERENIDPPSDSPAGIELAKSRAKWGTLLPKMLLAKSDAEFDQLMAGFKAYDDAARAIYLPEQQKAYDANKKKLGK